MIAVGMVKMPADPVVGVVPMRHDLMTTGGPVRVGHVVPAAGVLGCARSRIGPVLLQQALDDMIPLNVVQMAIVQVVRVALVPDRLVSAPCTMPV